MTFYAASYFTHQNFFSKYLGFGVAIALAVLLVFFLVRYFQNRITTKYRDLILIVALLIVFIIGTQIGNLEQVKMVNNQTTQMKQFIDRIRDDRGVNRHQVAVSSTSLKDGMLVKIKHQVYLVHFDDSYLSYELTKVNLMNHDVQYVK